MHHILAEATTHAENVKNWRYVFLGAGMVIVAGIWDRVAYYTTPRERRPKYEWGWVPMLLAFAGVVMVFYHIFDVKI